MIETSDIQTWTPALPWENLRDDVNGLELLEKEILPHYLHSCRWFAGKARKLSAVCIDQILSITAHDRLFYLILLKVKYKTGKLESYLLPVALVQDENVFDSISAKGIIATLNISEKSALFIDAIYDEAFRKFLFLNLFHSSKIKQQNGSIFFTRGKAFLEEDFRAEFSSRVLNVDQSNSSIVFLEKYFLKIYRKLFKEINPDVEMVSFLTEKAGYTHIPAFAGTFAYRKAYSAPITLGMMQEKVESITDVWSLTGDYLNDYLTGLVEEAPLITEPVLQAVALLAKRTAEMHLSLASDEQDPAFAPETFNDEYKDWIFTHFENLLKRRVQLCKENFFSLDEEGKRLAELFMDQRDFIQGFFSRVKDKPLQSLRTRIHGDYHLGQVLYNGSDFIILDFEGEPESSIADRKIKHSPLKDVAGMLRSFHYAVSAKLYFSEQAQHLSPEKIESATTHWDSVIADHYLQHYFEVCGESKIFGPEKSEIKFLLHLHLLEKAIYELGYELNGRPTWVKIPLKGIEKVVKEIS